MGRAEHQGFSSPLQAKLAQLHRHAEVMLESVLNNPNITEESVKAMAQHERCSWLYCCHPGSTSLHQAAHASTRAVNQLLAWQLVMPSLLPLHVQAAHVRRAQCIVMDV